MNLFDKIASSVSRHVAHAWFFTACVLLVVIWAPTMFFMTVDSSQLIINTATTIVTFLLVALLQNSQQQFENAVHTKLDAQSRVIAQLALQSPNYAPAITTLLNTIGAENRIGSS